MANKEKESEEKNDAIEIPAAEIPAEPPKVGTQRNSGKKIETQADEKAEERIRALPPMTAIQNKIRIISNRISDQTSGMGSVDKALNTERTIFVRHLEDLYKNHYQYFVDTK